MTSLVPSSTATGRPEPVLDAAKLAAAVSGTVLAVGALLVLIGWATADQVKSWAVIAGGIVTAIGTLMAVAMPIITAIGARAQVTPLAEPRSVDGVPLVTSAAPAVVAGPREFIDELQDLQRADETRPIPTYPPTGPVAAYGPWTPPTPAVVAHEPTPIGTEAEAASTGRISPLSVPSPEFGA